MHVILISLYKGTSFSLYAISELELFSLYLRRRGFSDLLHSPLSSSAKYIRLQSCTRGKHAVSGAKTNSSETFPQTIQGHRYSPSRESHFERVIYHTHTQKFTPNLSCARYQVEKRQNIHKKQILPSPRAEHTR